MVAANEGHMNEVEALLKGGANVNYPHEVS